ncbi:MAG: Fe-S assembly protein IscX [Chloroflexi bacterium]|jgi:FeS assembly protein IscX|uniref:Fe-S assembly protein IscX n=1 Tax=Candidatus Thermofonsia Clade 3 bacterium TaxID=2364212 RepID=A0A2M8QGU2_9CHLR|nr:Fe-S cluster assembly protein IscX [Candidatus Roseilinea sp. NK_OTU-006]PJF48988.1 MAG: Fe-S assembly protein IscX [Candidatus Thermofonsia Clade 3 bacterium]RMG63430.1 MAG: Fe-S assembly protein IscX [Chloroflexota bacterium]
MADPLYWDDAYPIALSLRAAHPNVADPTTLDLGLLHEWVIQLDGFSDDCEARPVEWLERIQIEWAELL